MKKNRFFLALPIFFLIHLPVHILVNFFHLFKTVCIIFPFFIGLSEGNYNDIWDFSVIKLTLKINANQYKFWGQKDQTHID